MTNNAYLEAIRYFSKNTLKLGLFIINDIGFALTIFLWYFVVSPSFDIIKFTQNPQFLGWKIQALTTVGFYAVGLILIFGFFSALSVWIVSGAYAQKITFRRIRSMWFLQTTFAAALTGIVTFLYVPFSAFLPPLGDKILLGLLSFLASYIAIASFVSGGIIIVTQDVRIWQLPKKVLVCVGQRWKQGIELFFAVLGIIAVFELIIVLIFNLLHVSINNSVNGIHIILVSLFTIVVRAYAKRVAVVWLCENNK